MQSDKHKLSLRFNSYFGGNFYDFVNNIIQGDAGNIQKHQSFVKNLGNPEKIVENLKNKVWKI